MSIPFPGAHVHDSTRPIRRGTLNSVFGTFVTVKTRDGRLIRILRDRVRCGLNPRGTYRKVRDPETLRLAEAVGLSYAVARQVRGT